MYSLAPSSGFSFAELYSLGLRSRRIRISLLPLIHPLHTKSINSLFTKPRNPVQRWWQSSQYMLYKKSRLSASFKFKCINASHYSTTSKSQLSNIISSKLTSYSQLARFDKPIGSWLLFLPCSWAILMMSPTLVSSLPYLALFGIGSIVMRGAGCTVNDYWDQDLDKKVERTRGRPIASGRVGSTEALAFLGVQLLIGFGVLLQLNLDSIVVGTCALPLVLTYPLFKR